MTQLSFWSAFVIVIMILLTNEEDLKSDRCIGYKSLATISYRERMICGGILLSLQWILTAAHCIYEDEIKRKSIIARVQYADGTGQLKIVAKGIPHKKFSTTADMCFDIGLLYTMSSFKESPDVSPARLAQKSFTCNFPIHLVVWESTWADPKVLTCYDILKMDIEACYKEMKHMRVENKWRRCIKTSTSPMNYSVGPIMCGDAILGIVFESKKVQTSTFAVYDTMRKNEYVNFIKDAMRNGQDYAVIVSKVLLIFSLCLFLALNLCL